MNKRLGIGNMSGGIARRSPLESGPVGEAKQTYSGFIRDTWGGYASRLVEYWGERGIDLTLQDACTALCISPEDVRNDARVQFSKYTDGLDYDLYEDILRTKWRKNAEAIYRPFKKDLENKVDAIETRFKVDDPVVAEKEASSINTDIKQLLHSEDYQGLLAEERALGQKRESAFHYSMMAPDEELQSAKADHEAIAERHTALSKQLRVLDTRASLMGMQRDALYSGTICTLDKFIEALYSVELSDHPCAAAWGGALEDVLYAINDTLRSSDTEHIRVPEIFVGADAFEYFKSNISIHPFVQAYIQQQQERIKPAFFTSVTKDIHPLFTGIGEK